MKPLMDDLISRQDAIRWVKTECNPYGNPSIDYESGIKVINHLENMSSAQHWIPCSERLPEEGISVLGTFESEFGNFTHITARLVFDGEDVWCSGQGLSAIAWIPLPRPYEEVKE